MLKAFEYPQEIKPAASLANATARRAAARARPIRGTVPRRVAELRAGPASCSAAFSAETRS
jgi:hypothetical protein